MVTTAWCRTTNWPPAPEVPWGFLQISTSPSLARASSYLTFVVCISLILYILVVPQHHASLKTWGKVSDF